MIVVKSDNVSSSTTNGLKPAQTSVAYDPAVAYIMEFSTVLALRDEATIQLVGKRVIEALQGVLRDSGRYHCIVVSRASFYLFKLLQVSYVRVPEDRPCVL